MLDRLAQIESKLPGWLRSAEGWRSKRIAYTPPVVWRLYRDTPDGLRVSLHRIFGCDSAFFHPHPWPSAIRVLGGAPYEMRVGYGPGVAPPPIGLRLVAEAGFSYEMTHPDGWHSVRIFGGTSAFSHSVMVSGPPWERAMPQVPERDLPPLAPEEAGALLATFRVYYPG